MACAGPTNSTAKVLFLNSFDEGMQIHYQRMGDRRPEILRYYVEAPAAGKYTVSALVSTVSHEGRNSIQITFRQGNRGISIKALQFQPVK